MLPPAQPSQNQGAALMAVLWIIGLLIALVTTTALLVLQDSEFDATRSQIFRARLLAETGVSLAMHPDIRPDDPLLHQILSDDEEFKVEVTGEDGLINPNILLQREDRDTWRRILSFWGIKDLQASDAIINALMDWVDPDVFERSPGAEARAYGRPGFPFNRPFRSVEEMSMVKGMQLVEQAFPAWRTWFSTHASGVLDVNEAQPELISALTGADITLARQFRTRRLGPDGIANTKDDLPAPDLAIAISRLGINGNPQQLATLLSVTSGTRRIISSARVGNLTRQLGIVVQGAPGQTGVGAILWMAER
ncbi:MAG: type II secretion system protein GspK [Verrucomicrobiaceae bacterium]|nr:type II secretion system protein GspK [Verrucomicrobiaceae bacterium]